ncbi:hypothetical protein E2C01_078853 [Portunus trituberculatus]|uniref:Uncharacterized protein n=1 Tax=Portunus trituberculatus TaxID=210409 RepID=A0A5B7IR82_PORTR|nr:hypothetical protein [Portunus trituberculatus]
MRHKSIYITTTTNITITIITAVTTTAAAAAANLIPISAQTSPLPSSLSPPPTSKEAVVVVVVACSGKEQSITSPSVQEAGRPFALYFLTFTRITDSQTCIHSPHLCVLVAGFPRYARLPRLLHPVPKT